MNKTSTITVTTDPRLHGVCIDIRRYDGNREIGWASIVLTPELARKIASDIRLEADKIDTLTGPSETLQNQCHPGVTVKGGPRGPS